MTRHTCATGSLFTCPRCLELAARRDNVATTARAWAGLSDAEARVAEDEAYEHRRTVRCSTTTPEVHERGEFPMTCYTCHVYADS